MDKKGIEASLRLSTKGRPFIGKRKLRDWLGVGDAKLREFTEGMDYRVSGNRIEFFVGDVADKIMEGVKL